MVGETAKKLTFGQRAPGAGAELAEADRVLPKPVSMRLFDIRRLTEHGYDEGHQFPIGHPV